LDELRYHAEGFATRHLLLPGHNAGPTLAPFAEKTNVKDAAPGNSIRDLSYLKLKTICYPT
jgi:hypothetical protein